MNNLEAISTPVEEKPSMPEPVVGVGLGSDYRSVTRKAVENAGGLGGIIKQNDIVVIKPNLVQKSSKEEGIVTDYRVVQEIVDLAKECGAKRIIIMEASPFGNVFEGSNYTHISGAELFDMNECREEDCYKIKPDGSLTNTALFIPRAYMDADVVIGAAKLKTHFEYDAVVSLSLKNSIGVPPLGLYGTDYKEKLHLLGLKEAIVDLNKIRRPDFAIIDGIVGGQGYGPLLVEPVQSNIVLAGTDPVAVDTAALIFMGFTVDEVPHVKLASKEGLGVSELSKIKIIGADLESIKMKFKRAQ